LRLINKKMGLFSTIFGTSSSEKEERELYINWIPLNSLEQLKEISELS